jgi:uncharacterized membrane protein
MQNRPILRLLSTTALTLTLVNSLGVDLQAGFSRQSWLQGDRTEAKTSGGRSRGGSFSRPSAPSGGGGGSYRSAPSYNNDPYSDPYYRQPRSVPVPIPIPVGGGYGYGYSSGGGFGLILLLLLGGGIILPIVWNYIRLASSQSTQRGSFGAGELDNDIVTITRLQVALLAQARYIQDDLTQLTLNVDPDSPEGLTEMLRESVLGLLRSPENWTHVRASSQTVKSREEATQLFEQMSIEERSKFNAETLARVGGQVRRQALRLPTDEDPASYIVVTLLVGTADDRPLINDTIHSADELQKVLQRIGGVSPEYLLVFELLWSPQDASDSLTRDELLTEYSDLVQI